MISFISAGKELTNYKNLKPRQSFAIKHPVYEYNLHYLLLVRPFDTYDVSQEDSIPLSWACGVHTTRWRHCEGMRASYSDWEIIRVHAGNTSSSSLALRACRQWDNISGLAWPEVICMVCKKYILQTKDLVVFIINVIRKKQFPGLVWNLDTPTLHQGTPPPQPSIKALLTVSCSKLIQLRCP